MGSADQGEAMNGGMKSTIIIPNYNGQAYLENCLRSVLADTADHPAKILVVDNGSADGSAEAAEAMGVPVLRMGRNSGFCGAVNAGIKASDTPYAILLNNDLTIEHGFVGAMEETLNRNPKAFSAGAQMRMMYAPDRIDSAGDYYCALGWAYSYGKGKKVSKRYEKPRKVFAACGGAAIYRRSVLEEIGLFDERHFAYLEDVDIGYRAKLHGYYNLYAPKAVVYHAGSAASGSRYNAFKVNLSSANSVYLIEKNMPPLQVLINLPFLILGFGVKFLFFKRKGLGKIYAEGVLRGFRIYYKEGGKKMHVPFRMKHLGNNVRIQWELWLNLIRRFFA